MYEAFYNLKEKPFTLLPDPGFLYLSKRHRMALTMLEYGLMNQAGFTVISGDIGAGKTTLIRHLLNNIDQEHTVGLISNTHRSFGELLQWVLLAFNLEHRDMDKVEMYRRFVDFIIDEYAHNRRTVLIIDEAQNMEAETLEELRMLSNINADKDQARKPCAALTWCNSPSASRSITTWNPCPRLTRQAIYSIDLKLPVAIRISSRLPPARPSTISPAGCPA